MAKFEIELPKEILADIQKVEQNTERIFGGMTQAGAEVVLQNVLANLPPELRNSDFARCINVTRTYRTPSDDGINNKVVISGYFQPRKGDKSIPAPLVANVFEYGTSPRATLKGYSRGYISKKPFFRKSFNKGQIEAAMKKAQKGLSGGIIDE